MSCENYGPQVCVDNEFTARSLAGGLARNDQGIAQGIQQEIFDRPPDLAIELIRRIQTDQDPQGADVLVVKPQFQSTPYGFLDTGRRLVVVDSPDGEQPIAMLNAQPDRNYYAQVPTQFNPFALATGIIVGEVLSNVFRPWQERDHQRMSYDRAGHWWDGQQSRERSPQIGITPHLGSVPLAPASPPAERRPYPLPSGAPEDPRLRRPEAPPLPSGHGPMFTPPAPMRQHGQPEETHKKKWP